MKRFWLVLLSLGLIVAFSTSAMAVDVKFNGEYYAAGMYLSKTSLIDGQSPNSALYFQRFRLGTEFIVSPGLKLVTRVDIMERAWGAARSKVNTTTGGAINIGTSQGDVNSAATTAENENIGFDLLYVQYVSPIGIFSVGYQNDGAWGTVFGDSMGPQPKIQYTFIKGGLAAGAYILKYSENSNTQKVANVATADTDVDMYAAYVNYTFKQGATGILFKHYRAASLKTAVGISQQFTAALPYAKVKFGPVSAEAEIIYVFGTYAKYDQGVNGTNVDYNQLSAYLKVGADFGMFYADITGAYMGGDDKTTPAIKEGNGNGGTDWNPCLIMFNFDRYYWAGTLGGNSGSQNPNARDAYLSTNDGGMSNAWFASLRGGVRPMDKLDIMAAASWARAVENPVITPWYSKDYGYEFDVTATYKITNNLSYMLGAGYWAVGDFYKGALETNKVQSDYLLINKLTLTF